VTSHVGDVTVSIATPNTEKSGLIERWPLLLLCRNTWHKPSKDYDVTVVPVLCDLTIHVVALSHIRAQQQMHKQHAVNSSRD